MKQLILVALMCGLCSQGRSEAKRNVAADSLPTAKVNKRKQTVEDLFKASDRIELLAYPMTKTEGSRKTNNNGSIRDGRFIVANVHEAINLADAQTKTLLSILSRPKVPADSLSGADCYNPQHAIIFFQNKKAIAFLELCFSCHRERHTDDVDFGILGQEKYCLLEQFFLASKIYYGIDKDLYKFECGEIRGHK